MAKRSRHPRFLWGSQYYRGPTPDRECWKRDMRRTREMGFNCVKNAVQWRWAHRKPDRFVFDDIDELMDLAGENELAVAVRRLDDAAWSNGMDAGILI